MPVVQETAQRLGSYTAKGHFQLHLEGRITKTPHISTSLLFILSLLFSQPIIYEKKKLKCRILTQTGLFSDN